MKDDKNNYESSAYPNISKPLTSWENEPDLNDLKYDLTGVLADVDDDHAQIAKQP